MKTKILLFYIVMLNGFIGIAQPRSNYRDSALLQREKYIRYHEIVKDSNKRYFDFFPVDETYKINCRLERATQTHWFAMKTSGNKEQWYRVFGTLYFDVNNVACKLEVYQSQTLLSTTKFADYLLIPFTDLTTGKTSYEAGRYIDASTGDMNNPFFVLDFNKAYNPYCAYSKGFNCPLPPAANTLPIAVNAGEKKFKAH